MFDLFGTLVPQFPRAEHDQALDNCSWVAGLDAERCRVAWRELYAAAYPETHFETWSAA